MRAGHVLHRHRVIAAHDCAFIPQDFRDRQGRSLAHVIRAGLEGQPQQADNLALHAAAEQFTHLQHRSLTLEFVDLDYRVEELRVLAAQLRHVLEGFHVLGEAGAAIAHPRVQETRPDALVEAHAARDFFHVRAQAFADVGDLVDEADLGRQERIRGVLDHFRRAQVGDHDRRAQRQVELRHSVGGVPFFGAKHGAVGAHEVANRGAFPQELGAAHHRKIDRLWLGFCHDVGDPVTGPHRDGALVDDDQRVIHRARD